MDSFSMPRKRLVSMLITVDQNIPNQQNLGARTVPL
jgi:hypothetical protein